MFVTVIGGGGRREVALRKMQLPWMLDDRIGRHADSNQSAE